MNPYTKYGLLSAAIVGTLGWLAWGGIKDGQTYFKTIPELHQMGDQAMVKRLRVSGYVQPHSISNSGSGVSFTIVENEGLENEGAHLKTRAWKMRVLISTLSTPASIRCRIHSRNTHRPWPTAS